MELTEAVQRILRHHVGLILALVGLGLLVPFLMNVGRDDTYVAFARLSIGAKDTTNAQQTEALVDTARGIVTSLAQVEAAIEEVSVQRDPRNVAGGQVDIKSIGTSGVLVLSVSDGDPEVAAALANALSEQLLASRRELLIDPLEQRLTQVDDDLAAVDVEIDDIQAQAQRPGAIIDEVRLRLEDSIQRRSDLQAERQALSESLAVTPKPALIDPATAPGVPEPASLAADLMVGGLLGLVVGVAIAAVIEALRPSIVSGNALARVLGVPVLGRLPNSPRQGGRLDHWLPHHLGLAASGAGVESVRLTGVGPEVDLKDLAKGLQAAVAPHLVVDVIESDTGDPRLSDTPGGKWSQADRERPGLVVVAPEVLPRKALSDLEYLLAITEWPLLGIIVYPRRRTARRVTASTGVERLPAPEPGVPSRSAAQF